MHKYDHSIGSSFSGHNYYLLVYKAEYWWGRW